jgi:LuxR family maltose regulon positive regulatory protein
MLFSQVGMLAEQSHHPRILARSQAGQVRGWLAQGQLEAVKRWRETWAESEETAPAYQDERNALTRARVLLALGEPAEALRLLESFRTLARQQRRPGSELEILIVNALAESALGKTGQGLRTLHLALSLAEPEGYVRLFVDEGLPMAGLLHLVLSRAQSTSRASYVRRLLNVLQAEQSAQAHALPLLLEPLSGRERTVLRLLAQGRSTPQMAAELVVSASTIKTQISSLYHKLNVHSREEAIVEAVRLQLL